MPNASPNLKPFGYYTSSTSLIVSWKAIAKDDINGILLSYRIFYKTLAENVIHLKTVPTTNLSCALNKLRKYTQYEIWVAGVTSKGVGGKSEITVISTDEDGNFNAKRKPFTLSALIRTILLFLFCFVLFLWFGLYVFFG